MKFHDDNQNTPHYVRIFNNTHINQGMFCLILYHLNSIPLPPNSDVAARHFKHTVLIRVYTSFLHTNIH